MLEIDSLTKRYGSVVALDGATFSAAPGRIVGFLGPNGAGKTTTIKMLLGIIYPSSGEGYVLGKEIGDTAVHRVISYLPERPYYYEHMTGMELLRFYDSLFGNHDQQKCQRLLEKVNLAADASKTISQYSKGMQQRVGLAQSLLNDPKLMFLDEPTAGLDPIAHREIRDLILSARDEGRTVFISSHELSEVELICDRVAIINKGKLEAQGKLSELLKGGRMEVTVQGVQADLAKKLAAKGVLHEVVDGFLIDVPEDEDVNSMVDAVRSAKGKVVSMVPRKKRLEDLFVETVRTANTAGGKK